MCEIFDEIRQEGEKRGIEQGIEQGEERALLASARRVMEQLSFSAQQALDFLGVGEPQRSRLLVIL